MTDSWGALGALFLWILMSPVPVARAEAKTAEQHYKRGMAAYALEDWNGAIAEFEVGFRDEPKAAFLYNIAQAHRQAKRPEEALRFYQKYLELAPDASDRGDVETLIGILQKAIDEQQRAMRHPPTRIGSDSDRPASPPVARPEATPPSSPPAAPRGPDKAGIALLATGGLVALVGVGLAAYGAVADGQARDHGTKLDLGARQDLESRANVVGAAGYTALGVGAALAVGGLVKLLVKPRSSSVTVGFGAAPGQVMGSIMGRF